MSKNKYDELFRIDAIEVTMAGDRSILAQVARGLGIDIQSLCKYPPS
ncbi:hypothetical protein [Sessilibacter corallicola]|uniref:Transposase n=1 Tax=Sessilibacter corallicola TaxID=2904075 RepID=A0ABQ0A866_9GAMM